MKSYRDFGIEISSSRSAGNVKVRCPVCSKDNGDKPLSVDLGRGIWHCFRCDEKGSLGLTKDQWNMTKPVWQKPKIKHGDDTAKEQAYRYLMGRGISREVLDEARIDGSAYPDKAGTRVEAIVIPYLRDNETITIKYRRLAEKKFSMSPDCERILYGLDYISEELTVWVEGEVDVLSARTAGAAATISLPAGAKQPGEKDSTARFAPLDAAWDRLSKVRKFVLFLDRDAPGAELEAELIIRLGSERCWIALFPSDCDSQHSERPACKDANDILMWHGVEAVKDAIDLARPVPDEGIVTPEQITKELSMLYENKMPGGVYIGWHNLAKLYRPPRGQFTVVTGAPGCGKSNLLDAMMVNINEEAGWRFGLFSPEMFPPGRHAAQIIEKRAGVPFAEISPDHLTGLDQWFNENFFIIRPKDFGYQTILEKANLLVNRYGIKGLVIDPWNRLEHEHAGSMAPIQYLVKVLTALVEFAQTRQVHVWLIAHPHKLMYDSQGKVIPPGAYNISGGAHFFNIADFIMVVHRDTDEYCGPVDVYIKKVRFKENGRCGKVTFRYEPRAGLYIPHGYDRSPRVEEEI